MKFLLILRILMRAWRSGQRRSGLGAVFDVFGEAPAGAFGDPPLWQHDEALGRVGIALTTCSGAPAARRTAQTMWCPGSRRREDTPQRREQPANLQYRDAAVPLLDIGRQDCHNDSIARAPCAGIPQPTGSGVLPPFRALTLWLSMIRWSGSLPACSRALLVEFVMQLHQRPVGTPAAKATM
jgi:hypothetical protein